MPGPDLAQVIAREAPLALQRSARIMDQVLAALEEAHAQGIVHRDLKPGNIMLVPRRDEPEFVKVCDFGIAKVKSVRARPSLTMAGLVFGTPEYMSPEQACGGDVDARTDLYAVAAILYQLVSGQLPFPAPSPTEVLARILRDEPERPSKRGYVTIPEPIENLIMLGLSKDREQRPQTAAEFRIMMRDAWAGIIDYWPGQSTDPADDLAARAIPDRPRCRAGVELRTPPPWRERRRRPLATPAAPTSSAPGIINWGLLFERRPTKSAILGFSLTLACGGLALWGLTTRQHRTPPVEASSSSPHAAPAPVASAPSGEGMIVVPAAPRPARRSPSHSDERRASRGQERRGGRRAPRSARASAKVGGARQAGASRGRDARHRRERGLGAAIAAARRGSRCCPRSPSRTLTPAPTEAPAALEPLAAVAPVTRQRRHRPQAARDVDPVGGRGLAGRQARSVARRCSAPRSTSARRTR